MWAWSWAWSMPGADVTAGSRHTRVAVSGESAQATGGQANCRRGGCGDDDEESWTTKSRQTAGQRAILTIVCAESTSAGGRKEGHCQARIFCSNKNPTWPALGNQFTTNLGTPVDMTLLSPSPRQLTPWHCEHHPGSWPRTSPSTREYVIYFYLYIPNTGSLLPVGLHPHQSGCYCDHVRPHGQRLSDGRASM